jgi:serine/threonine protein phosphatase PrpC
MRLGRSLGLSDPGRRRRRNEDSYVVSPPLFAVADGMGGAQAGELASRLAVEAMGGGSVAHSEEQVISLIREANRRVFARSHEDAAASGMGTTMTAALVGDDGQVAIGHVGDSRAYLLRGGRLEQLTEDHSLVAELVRTGRLSAEEAEDHPQRSVITRALGTDPEVEVDAFTVPAEVGDLFLICSDGLTTMLGDEEILQTLEGARDDLEHAARKLVQQANRGGGDDNITVVFFEIAEDVAGSDEDTLTELDGMPAIDDTAVVPVPAEPAEPAPTHRDELDETAKRVLAILAVVAVVFVGIALLLLGLR